MHLSASEYTTLRSSAFLLLVFGLSLMHHIATAQLNWDDEDDDFVSTSMVEAVLGKATTLPCDIEASDPSDRAHMVLWFRENTGKPLFSFDIRGRPIQNPLIWSDVNAFGPRAMFLISKPAALVIQNTQLDDEGIYRCRVDFSNSPTRNHRINLTVIVPPHQLLVYDTSGQDVAGKVGPLLEGNSLILSCEVRGGRPEPRVTWLSGNKILKTGTGVAIARHVIVNRLEINSLGREQLNSTYVCQASNTILLPATERTVRIEMLLKPISTSILEKPKQFTSNSEVTLACVVDGSVPDTEIKWMQNNRIFGRGKTIQIKNSTRVTSLLTFQPLPDDDETVLKCEGSNPVLPNSAKEDSLVMNVLYPPQVSLSLGSTLNPTDIKEGDDVYFECHIKANPKEHRITWSHDGIPVTQNVSWGIIISTKSLVLQRVTRLQSGLYACTAINDRGETQSEPVSLRIHFSPICITSSVMVIGSSLDESVTVPCRVAGDPSVITFEWTFANSGERFDVTANAGGGNSNSNNNDDSMGVVDVGQSIGQGGNGGNGGGGGGGTFDYSDSTSNHGGFTFETINQLTYTAKSERDYGTLACWGKNKIGKQVEPCLFQIVPAAKPSPLKNCTLRPFAATATTTLVVSNLTTIYGSYRDMNFINPKLDNNDDNHFPSRRISSKTGNNRMLVQSSSSSLSELNEDNKSQVDGKLVAKRDTDKQNSIKPIVNSDSGSYSNSVSVNSRVNEKTTNDTRALPQPQPYKYEGKDFDMNSIEGRQSSSSSSTSLTVGGGGATTTSTMELECIAGYDGGLPQHFVLEAYDSRTKRLRLNVTSAYTDIPLFRFDLADLLPSESHTPTLHLIAYSANQKGRSEPFVMEDIAINEPEKRTEGTTGFSILPLAALLTGTLLTVGVAVLLIVVLTIRRKREKPIQGVDLKEKHIVATPAGDVGVGGQPRYVVAYTLKQTETTQQKQPDILNPDGLQSIKEVTSKVKSPVGCGGSGGVSDPDKLLYGSSTMYAQQSVDGITVDGNLLDSSGYYMQPPHYSILGSSSSSSNNLIMNNEPPHEYSTGGYSTVIVAQTEPFGPYSCHQTVPQLDYRLLGSVKEEDVMMGAAATIADVSGVVSKSRPAEFRYSGSDFSMSECISNSNTSTLGAKNRNRHIITDTLPGPESCV